MEKPTGVIVFLFMFILFSAAQRNVSNIMENPFHVGVILDLTTLVGKMGQTSISMAIDDFYSINSNYTARLVLHTKDSGNDVVQAASAGSYPVIFCCLISIRIFVPLQLFLKQRDNTNLETYKIQV